MEAVAVPARVSLADQAATELPVESRALTTLASLEEALVQGLDDDWRGVVENDPLASLFQTSGWCLPWYRCYAEAFTPYVIVVSAGNRVVGIVPMAVDRATGALVFASHTMADYRDIVALPGFREQVVSELVRHYLALRVSAPLQVGWIDPASDTPALLARVCAGRGLRQTVRRQPCWRWFPPAPARPSAQKFLNWYKRNGTATFEVVESEPAWQRLREEYYRQHTLRQIQAGRPRIFDDTHTALYDTLFHAPDVPTHMTAFCHNGTMVAGHFGYVWRGVLLLGPPSIRLEDEQRSPAVILLSWIIQNAAALGFKGFDLTIGESDFKKRLGNQCVELSMVEIHAKAATYHLQSARDRVVKVAKRLVETAAGPDAWKAHVKPAGATLAFERSRLAELGVPGAIRAVAAAVRHFVYDSRVERTYALTPATLQAVNAAPSRGETRENVVEDLLLWNGTSPTVARAVTACARSYPRLRATGHTLHTMVVDGTLAGWTFSSATELRDSFLLPDFHETPAGETLVRAAARHRFEQGSAELRLTIPGDDVIWQPVVAKIATVVAQRSAPRVLGSARLYDRAARLWQRLTWRAIRRRIAQAIRYQAEERTYRLSPEEAADLPASADFARDRWEDLELFVPSEPRHTREACLADWRGRRARGEHVYTRVEDGRLAAYGWVVERQQQMPLYWVNQSVDLPDGSAVIYDFYTLPEYRHRDFYQRLLMHAMQDAARIPGTQWICLSILASDTVPRWWVERMGMELTGSYLYRRTLWWRMRRAAPAVGSSTA